MRVSAFFISSYLLGMLQVLRQAKENWEARLLSCWNRRWSRSKWIAGTRNWCYKLIYRELHLCSCVKVLIVIIALLAFLFVPYLLLFGQTVSNYCKNAASSRWSKSIISKLIYCKSLFLPWIDIYFSLKSFFYSLTLFLRRICALEKFKLMLVVV